MQYRNFGNTGERVSALGFGTMRLPVYPNSNTIDEEYSKQLIRYAIDNGVNYIDTAYSYNDGVAERVTGDALLEGYRDKVYLATKAPVWLYENEGDFDKYLNIQLDRLHTDHIDFYLLHSLDANHWDNKVIKYNVLNSLLRAKQQGKVKYIGFSFNDDFDMFKWICDYWNEWDFCQIHLNYIDEEYQAGLKGLEYAKAKGMGVNIMEPLRNGYLANVPPMTRVVFDEICAEPVEIAMQYLWDKEGVSCVLSDMGSYDNINQNLSYAKVSSIGMLSGKRVVAIKKAQQTFFALRKIDCNSCYKCNRCPQHVAIPRNFDAINKLYIHSDPEVAKDYYRGSVALIGGEATACIDCKWCESVCPQHIEISSWMKKLPQLLS
ncbi:MAG: aldo/keto reductase [Oscillospiraceae bacterium]|nr:aldo/keto reductase [Oscillospiraceae bacterium]